MSKDKFVKTYTVKQVMSLINKVNGKTDLADICVILMKK